MTWIFHLEWIMYYVLGERETKKNPSQQVKSSNLWSFSSDTERDTLKVSSANCECRRQVAFLIFNTGPPSIDLSSVPHGPKCCLLRSYWRVTHAILMYRPAYSNRYWLVLYVASVLHRFFLFSRFVCCLDQIQTEVLAILTLTYATYTNSAKD